MPWRRWGLVEGSVIVIGSQRAISCSFSQSSTSVERLEDSKWYRTVSGS